MLRLCWQQPLLELRSNCTHTCKSLKLVNNHLHQHCNTFRWLCAHEAYTCMYASIKVRVSYMYLLTSMLLRSATTREGKPPSMHQKRATDMTASTRWGRMLSLSCARRHAHSCVQLVTHVNYGRKFSDFADQANQLVMAKIETLTMVEIDDVIMLLKACVQRY